MSKIKEPSFGKLIDEGKTKEEICKLKNLSPEAYEKSYASLMLIRDAKRRAIERYNTIEVNIEGHSGLYLMDTEHKEFRSMVNPEDKIAFDTDEPILITAFTCQHCGKLMDKLDYKESGTYDFKEDDYVPEKIEFSCPLCRAPFNKEILKAMGATI